MARGVLFPARALLRLPGNRAPARFSITEAAVSPRRRIGIEAACRLSRLRHTCSTLRSRVCLQAKNGVQVKFALCVAILFASVCGAALAEAQMSGQMTDLRVVGIQVRNGTMVVELLHNGAFGLPEGPGLVHGWVNEFGGVCNPHGNNLSIAIPAWRFSRVKPTETMLTVTAWQAGTNARIEVKYTAAEVQALVDGTSRTAAHTAVASSVVDRLTRR